MSLIFATQLTGAATAALAVFAIVTAWYARKAFLKQSKEVSDQASMLEIQSEQLAEQRKVNTEQIRVLALQASELRGSLEERTRDTAERRRAQASRVFIWTETGPDPRLTDAQIEKGVPWRETVTAHVNNTSDQPIYCAELVWDDSSTPLAEVAGRSGAERLPVFLLPGSDAAQTRQAGPETRAVVLRFRDAAGVIWLRGPEGDLVDLSEPPTRETSGEGDSASQTRSISKATA